MSDKGPIEPREEQSGTEPIGTSSSSNGVLSVATNGAPGPALLDPDIGPVSGPPRRLLVWEQMLDVLNLAYGHERSESAAEPNRVATAVGRALDSEPLDGRHPADGGSQNGVAHGDSLLDELVAAVAVRDGAALRDDPALLATVSELVRASKRGRND